MPLLNSLRSTAEFTLYKSEIDSVSIEQKHIKKRFTQFCVNLFFILIFSAKLCTEVCHHIGNFNLLRANRLAGFTAYTSRGALLLRHGSHHHRSDKAAL